jgi:enamine deaminase RidA (YjgF/YER057c/UK114 family)
MTNRLNISSKAVWEDEVGYSRAVKVGNQIEISGTVSVKKGKIYAPKDPYGQTKRILRIIEKTLSKAGATLEDVIRTRMYVTDITQWQEVGKAHGEVFKQIKPATTMVEVKALIDQEFMVEIEATAVISGK